MYQGLKIETIEVDIKLLAHKHKAVLHNYMNVGHHTTSKLKQTTKKIE